MKAARSGSSNLATRFVSGKGPEAAARLNFVEGGLGFARRPLRIGQGRQAGTNRLTVDTDRATPASADSAAEFGSGQADNVANGP